MINAIDRLKHVLDGLRAIAVLAGLLIFISICQAQSAGADELVSIFPQNGSIYLDQKPVIKLVFSKEVDEKNAGGSLTCNGKKRRLIEIPDDARTLVYVPYATMEEANCTFEFKMEDSGAKLEKTIDFSKACDKPETNLIITNPRIFKVKRTFHFKNNSTNRVFVQNATVYLVQNSSNSIVRIMNMSEGGRIERDGFGNHYAIWNESLLKADENYSVFIEMEVLTFDVNHFLQLDLEQEANSEVEDLARFLQEGEYIESNNQDIVLKAREFANEDDKVVEELRAYSWILDNIRYDESYAQRGGALETLGNKSGVCHGIASLFVAFSRANGVPAKYVYGILIEKKSSGLEGGAHAWAEFHDLKGGWIPVETSNANSSKAYSFGKMTNNHLKLAGVDSPSNLKESYVASAFSSSKEGISKQNYDAGWEIGIEEMKAGESTFRNLYYLIGYVEEMKNVKFYYSNSSAYCKRYEMQKEAADIVEECKTKCNESRIENELSIVFSTLKANINDYIETKILEMRNFPLAQEGEDLEKELGEAKKEMDSASLPAGDESEHLKNAIGIISSIKESPHPVFDRNEEPKIIEEEKRDWGLPILGGIGLTFVLLFFIAYEVLIILKRK